jgi:REP element-mobilizing transposase RayT/nitrogen fixation-related uncharacterized protein
LGFFVGKGENATHKGAKMKKIPRTHIEGAIFYVTSRGDNNEEIFKEKQDYQVYLELLNKYKEHYGFKLISYVLMPNHLHLLIELKEGLSISDIMHDLNANYTKYFNGKIGRKGHLFKERSRMNVIEKASYLSAVAAYIHLNPVALGLAKTPEEYPYSSYNDSAAVIQGTASNVILRPKAEGSKDSSPRQGGAQNDKLSSPQNDTLQMQALGRELAKNAVIGSPEFINRVNSVVKAQELAAKRRFGAGQRKLIFAGAAAILILAVGAVYLYKAILSKQYEDEMNSYYKGLSKTLQIEKQKVRILEERMEKGAGTP